MDPVSHLLFGRTVALTVPHRSTLNGMTAALLIGSIAPDIDAVLAFRGFDIYLRAHASGTHSLAGTVVESALLASVLHRFVRESRFITLLVASWVGMVGHILCDIADDGDIAVFRPFSDTFIGWHLFPMGDPVVVAVLAATVLVAWRWAQRPRYIAAGALIGLGCLAGAKLGSQQWAIASYRNAVARDGASVLDIGPTFDPFGWMIYDRAGDRVRGWRVDARNGRTALAFERRDRTDTSLVDASRSLPVVSRFLSFARIPFARVEAGSGRALVLWSDARWCSTDRCDLSFGGAFDASRAPLFQVIRIGSFTQQRSIER